VVPRAESRLSRGRWIPWLFVAGFLVIIAVNGVLVWVAIGTFSGLETDHPYERGLDYNRTLEAAREQQARAWQVSLDVVPSTGRRVSVVASFLDGRGRPIDGLTAEAEFVRPVRADDDVAAVLAGEGAGRYGAELELPLGGVWDVELIAEGESGRWQSRQRLQLP
jgi:nitrogen fixation protein FixH